MVSFDQFLGLLRACLLDMKGVEVVLNPHMLTHCLFMSHDDWDRFSQAAVKRLHIDVERRALTRSSTILDLYFASIACSQTNPSRARVFLAASTSHPRAQRHAALH